MNKIFPDLYWQYKNPVDVGLSKSFDDKLTDYIKKNSRRIKSFVVVKDSSIIYEEYFHRGSDDSLNELRSVTKSINSLILGIAIDKGFIDSEDDLVSKYFPDYAEYGELNQQVTIKHFLQMSNGIVVKNESSGSMLLPFMQSKPSLEMYFRLPIKEELFNKFSYNTITSFFLVELIKKVIDIPYENFADKYLFSPLGIIDYDWNSMTKNSGYMLSLKTTDLARVGLLMLNNGKWKDHQIVSEYWIKKSLKAGVSPNYGYQWWLKPEENIFYGLGHGGQALICVPKHNLIVAGNSMTREGSSGGKRVHEVFFDFVLREIGKPE
jgi:CubicO group peptidase (beta-lactamase class C family)